MTYDIHFEGVPVDTSRGFEFLTFGDYTQHVGIKGIQKLVNQVIKCLLTPVGSDISDIAYGTNLMQAFQGNIEKTALRELATMAVRDTELKIQEYDSQKSSPMDERLASVEIADIVVSANGTGLTLKIIVRNEAGTRALTAIPMELD